MLLVGLTIKNVVIGKSIPRLCHAAVIVSRRQLLLTIVNFRWYLSLKSLSYSVVEYFVQQLQVTC